VIRPEYTEQGRNECVGGGGRASSRSQDASPRGFSGGVGPAVHPDALTVARDGHRRAEPLHLVPPPVTVVSAAGRVTTPLPRHHLTE